MGLFDIGGRLIAQAAHIPLHRGSLLGAVEAVRRDFPQAAMREGDAFFCNDPYLAAGTHMPDISVVTPVFVDDEPRFFTEKAPITVTVRVDGGRPDFDVAGSAPQSRGALNVPESGLKATVFYAVKALLDLGLLQNSGFFEAVRITAPEGSIVNPRFPAAVGARSITCQRIAGAIFGAFRGRFPPEQV